MHFFFNIIVNISDKDPFTLKKEKKKQGNLRTLSQIFLRDLIKVIEFILFLRTAKIKLC